MHSNILTISIVLLTLTTGCSVLSKIVYRPEINQGNYLTPEDAKKIQKGMTQQQIAYILGTPTLKDPFGKKTWFYIFRQQSGHTKITQHTITLTFNDTGVLINMHDNSTLP
ncbi:outer membrane protein assembly factor BamE [Candidatus Gillettellia adelgis]